MQEEKTKSKGGNIRRKRLMGRYKCQMDSFGPIFLSNLHLPAQLWRGQRYSTPAQSQNSARLRTIDGNTVGRHKTNKMRERERLSSS